MKLVTGKWGFGVWRVGRKGELWAAIYNLTGMWFQAPSIDPARRLFPGAAASQLYWVNINRKLAVFGIFQRNASFLRNIM